MKKLIATLVVNFASYASIFGLYFTLIPLSETRPLWHWALLVLIALSACILIGIETADFVQSAPRTYKSQKKINSYMSRWVSSDGRVVIFSRDLSWAHESSVRAILRDKAKRRELTICLEHDIPLTDDLRDRGATIITYQTLGHIPKARFTIVGFGREGARVAVGVNEKGKHVIQEYRSGSHPFFAVAEDLVKFLIAAEPGRAHVSQM
jgi:hypothetical protein